MITFVDKALTDDSKAEPQRCQACGQYRTADVAYAGHRCCCEGSSLVLAYLAECDKCTRPTCIGCPTAGGRAGAATYPAEGCAPGAR